MSPKEEYDKTPQVLPLRDFLPIQAIMEQELNMEQDEPVPIPIAEEPYTTIAQDILPYKLDCIALSQKHLHYGLFSFGSYEIDPDENRSTKRHGNLYLALLDPMIAVGYRIVQTIENLPGILDMKWEPTNENRLVIATSESVIIYSLDISLDRSRYSPDPLTFALSEYLSYSTDGMALYIQWMNSTDLIFSDSLGKITVWTTTVSKNCPTENDGNELSCIKSEAIHEYFVWFVHFDPESGIVYSGDDIGILFMFHIDNLQTSAYRRRRRFDTGVTSILTKEDIVAVGCYDEKLRIFTRSIEPTTKQVTLSQCLLEMDLNGTVWRTLWVPPLLNPEPNPEVFKMIVAAGRNGIHVINFNRSDWTWDTTFCCFEFKDKLAYGVDIKAHPGENLYTVASCYFDSKCLHIFTMKP